MRGTVLLIAAMTVAGALLGACGGDEGEEPGPELAATIERLSNDLSAQISGIHLEELGEDARVAIDQNCSQLTDEAAESSLEDEFTDLCGDIRQALTEGRQEALEEAGQRLAEITP